jgi:hypothetical protein
MLIVWHHEYCFVSYLRNSGWSWLSQQGLCDSIQVPWTVVSSEMRHHVFWSLMNLLLDDGCITCLSNVRAYLPDCENLKFHFCNNIQITAFSVTYRLHCVGSSFMCSCSTGQKIYFWRGTKRLMTTVPRVELWIESCQGKITFMCDFRLPLQCSWGLYSSGILCGIRW